jgi:cell division protein FtsN
LAEWSGTNSSVEFTPDALEAVSELSGGLPRLVNLLCDRSLEEACASRLRTIDAKLVRNAARSLGIGPVAEPESAAEPFWSLMRSEAPAADKAAESVTEARPEEPEPEPEPDAVAELPATPRVPTYWLLVSGLAAAAVVFIWLGVRSARTPAPEPPRTAVSPPAAATAARGATRSDASPAVKPPVPATPAPPPATAPQPSAASSPAPAAAASAAGERFDIVVASFRTDERATAVASEVTTIGLPVRRRVVDGWQQVVCGPFVSRADADAAQQRLASGGLAGTQIVKISK